MAGKRRRNLGMSVTDYIKSLKNSGRPRPPKSPEMKAFEAAKAETLQGGTYGDAAKRFNTSRGKVRAVIKKEYNKARAAHLKKHRFKKGSAPAGRRGKKGAGPGTDLIPWRG